METLTKENFWDEISEKYPKAMAHFGNWIDAYKKESKWDYLFNADVVYDQAGVPGRKLTTKAPKYHELPITMQFGIFTQYLYEWMIGLNYTGQQEVIKAYMTSPDFYTGVKDYISGVLNMMEGCPA